MNITNDLNKRLRHNSEPLVFTALSILNSILQISLSHRRDQLMLFFLLTLSEIVVREVKKTIIPSRIKRIYIALKAKFEFSFFIQLYRSALFRMVLKLLFKDIYTYTKTVFTVYRNKKKIGCSFLLSFILKFKNRIYNYYNSIKIKIKL